MSKKLLTGDPPRDFSQTKEENISSLKTQLTNTITNTESLPQLASTPTGERDEVVSFPSKTDNAAKGNALVSVPTLTVIPPSNSILKKFRLLMWKNYVLQKRHKIQTAFEIILPLFFISILVIIRRVTISDKYPDSMLFPSWSPTNTTTTVIGVKILEALEYANRSKHGTTLLPKPKLPAVLYAPNNSKVNDIMNNVQSTFLTFSFNFKDFGPYPIKFERKPFVSEKQLLEDCAKTTGDDVLGAIIFQGDITGDKITYKLRMPAAHKTVFHRTGTSAIPVARWYTSLVYPFFKLLGPRHFDDFQGSIPGYYSQGFTYLQFAVDSSIIQWVQSSVDISVPDSKVNDFRISLQRFPYPPFIDDIFIVAIERQLPLMVMLSFIYSFMNITKSVVIEKERKLKESMKMMGLPNYLHWSAWFLKSFLFLLISLALMVAQLKIKWKDGLAIIPTAHETILVVFLLAYIFSLIMLAFFVSTLFSRANPASTGAGVVWFIVFFPYFFLSPRYNTLSQTVKMSFCILPNTAMAFGWQIILMHEATSGGIKWSTIATGANPEDKFTLLHCIGMLLVDGFVYFLLAIYIEGVLPGEFGVPLPWYFPFSKTYWCGHKLHANSINVNVPHNRTETNVNFEEPPVNAKAGIKIQALSKTFGKKQAVRNLTLNMYVNQITVLLGHNGAGKTTTMSILTGLFPPTSGTAIINNFDIRTNIKDVRCSLGLCPQHDVLFDELTCEEHLKFFCWMKGCKKVSEETDHILNILNLEPKRHAQAGTLSGGMRRKLSVGIALCGGSRVVLLDEPTSGMDPGARRSTWDLLTSEKRNRTILLSTHFMDEADLLGDRIAIMADGQLESVGSSLFLKKRYGAGYHLTVVKKPGCDVNKITEVLRKHLDEATIEQDVGAELSYALPDSKSKLFADMFDELEERRDELMIDSYGAGITTMEEVFVRVGKEVEERKQSTEHEQHTNVVHYDAIQPLGTNYKLYEEHHYNSGLSLFTQQLRAMMAKKMLFLIRNRILFLVQTSIPVANLLMAVIVIKTLPKILNNDSLKINLDTFHETVSTITTLSCHNVNDAFCSTYEQFGRELKTTIKTTGTQPFSNFILSESLKSLENVDRRYIIGMEKSGNNVTGFFNNQPYHGLPITLNLVMNTLFRHLTSNVKKQIIVINHPLPYTPTDEINNNNDEVLRSTGFQVGVNLTFGMSFLASSFVIFLIRERVSKAKHLQFVSGARFWIFWSANFIFDFLLYLVTCVLLIIVIVLFRIETLNELKTLRYIFLLFVVYGWAMLPLMYLCSFCFTLPSSGFARMTIFNIFSGLAPLIAVTILQIPTLNLLHTAKLIDWIFMIFPNYDIGYGILQISKNVGLHKTCPRVDVLNNLNRVCKLAEFNDNPCCTEFPYDHLHIHPAGIGRNLLYLFVIGLLSFIVLFIAEGKLIQKCNFGTKKSRVQGSKTMSGDSEDNDVAAEAARIRTTNLEELFKTETLVIKDLSKSYGSFTAVQCLNLGVTKKECFGLLGVNGAGKTSTFKMLTGDLRATSGDAFICGNSMNSDIKNVQKNLGYCPQFDAHIDELTARELIRLFARLRGIQEKEIDELANKLCHSLLFREHMDKRVGSYSGGNKRKMSTAIALVGNPPVVFLDEPSTGMDPVARRHLWDCVAKVRDSGTSVILTSHTMEECEALCTRLVIMVNGQFCCLGSIQHLKSKFGEGYTVIAQMKIKSLPNRRSLEETQKRLTSDLVPFEIEMQPLQMFIENSFSGSILKDIHPGYVHYHVTDPNVRWGTLFRKMEEAKVMFKLEAYSVGQTSLEQVFINFAKTQAGNE